MEETDFQELVHNAWMAPVSTTNPDCVLRDKLKNVKIALKTWSKEKYRGLDAEIEMARKEADLWEREAESKTLEDYELELWQKARADWIEKDGIKAKMLKQKARIQWYEEGDENSKYFHAKDVLNLPGINSFNGINRERWKAVIWSTLYVIWCNRNQMIFRRNGSMIPDVFKEVPLRSFEWISARSKKDEVKQEEWFGGPIDRV
ncbi:Transposon TX1 [Artemisia annua]|uniref:Transposon TX1 n=1 Tax=Artemisia annua TaxID=35608 RepID=A0A2U1KWQ9_ARTAN|nr:Transposon TX1 [Artemisia annua]